MLRFGMQFLDQRAEVYEAAITNARSTISSGRLPAWDFRLLKLQHPNTTRTTELSPVTLWRRKTYPPVRHFRPKGKLLAFDADVAELSKVLIESGH